MLLGLTLTSACSTPSVKDTLEEKYYSGRAHPAAYGADGFMVDHAQEIREYRKWEFYYKHCALVSRDQFPSKSNWECSEPY